MNYRFYAQPKKKKINESMPFGSIQQRNEIYEIEKTTKIFARHNQYLFFSFDQEYQKHFSASDKQNGKKGIFISYFVYGHREIYFLFRHFLFFPLMQTNTKNFLFVLKYCKLFYSSFNNNSRLFYVVLFSIIFIRCI